ncbi:TetR/AcrR family transcriptional regulator [Ruania alba]|uniref:DNA-binding transcriptional regulator, AcrR family n=1 Tax=Ruania alba TaxID=648782 RepID=A0A1H5MYE8_9MICO|nr:TetR/AcrR family transcriptional regulator [Ruania alba]SEE94355.1 DNA-binding transcriptional regulator, AcrR family [Ruania alba]
MSTSTYHHGDLKNALLRAAERMIDADAARRFSLRELAREAGVSHAAPYRHFSDRDHLVAELAALWMADFVDHQEASAAGVDARANLLAAGVAYVTWAANYPSRFVVVFDPAVNRGPGPTGLGVHAGRHIALLDHLVGDAITAGVLTGPPEVTGRRLWATAHGLAGLVSLGHLPLEVTREILDRTLDAG